MLRCVRPGEDLAGLSLRPGLAFISALARADQSGKTMTVHYLSNGTCMLRFSMKKQVHDRSSAQFVFVLC